MHKIIFAFFIIAFSFEKSYAQENLKSDSTPEIDREKSIVFTRTEKMPEFPGGDSAWRNYILNNLNPNIPVNNGAPIGTYTIITRFIVNQDGTLQDITPETIYGYGMEAEARRILIASPKWIPAKQNGYVVRCYIRQPVTFVVQSK